METTSSRPGLPTPAPAHLAVSIAPDFADLDRALAGYALEDFNEPVKVEAYCALFGLRELVQKLEADLLPVKGDDADPTVDKARDRPFEPEMTDLCRLHFLVLRRRAVNVLELGSGFSTAIMAQACQILHGHFAPWAQANLRTDKVFHIYSVEEDSRFMEISQARLGQGLRPYATLSRSTVDLVLHENRFATLYTRLPNIAPDLIYIDGPSQFATTAEIAGFSMDDRARMPMSADVLRFEFFLEPGCLIVLDGRTQNARFLKAFLKRDWAYSHDPQGDVHYFELQETALGPLNQRRLDFCLSGNWLL